MNLFISILIVVATTGVAITAMLLVRRRAVGLALIYERRANLVADIAAHVAFNVIGIVIIFSSR